MLRHCIEIIGLQRNSTICDCICVMALSCWHRWLGGVSKQIVVLLVWHGCVVIADQGRNKAKSGCVHTEVLCCHCGSNERNNTNIGCISVVVWFYYCHVVVINKLLWLYGCGGSAGQDRNKAKIGFINNVVLRWHLWLEETLNKCGYISMVVELCCHCWSGKYQHKYWLYWSAIVVLSCYWSG
mgnify:CR=1 FL=1